jgi:endonuclease YncB( thermonuclease family)
LEEKMRKIINIMIFILFFTLSISETLIGTVSYVSDGDTLHLKTSTGKYKIRFFGVDAPESTQEYGLEAKSFVLDRVLRKQVKIEVTDTDRYGRKIGKIYYGNGKYLNEELVRTGNAWWYRYYAKGEIALKRAEKYAKANKRGLWSQTNPVAPWEYRKAKRSSKKVSSFNVTKNLDAVVYVTKTGKKYHREGCRYLKTKYKSYTVREAEVFGYTSCSRY